MAGRRQRTRDLRIVLGFRDWVSKFRDRDFPGFQLCSPGISRDRRSEKRHTFQGFPEPETRVLKREKTFFLLNKDNWFTSHFALSNIEHAAATFEKSA